MRNGTASLDDVKRFTAQRAPEPIIVGKQVVPPDGDRVIDGKHRYLAAVHGMIQTSPALTIPGYLLEPEQWRPFLLKLS